MAARCGAAKFREETSKKQAPSAYAAHIALHHWESKVVISGWRSSAREGLTVFFSTIEHNTYRLVEVVDFNQLLRDKAHTKFREQTLNIAARAAAV
jgi:hypothetical protein